MSTRLPSFQPSIRDREVEAAISVLRSGGLTTGRRCKKFEERFEDLLGGGVESIAVSSTTAGIQLAAEACGIGLGDAVLAPTLTFSAAAAAFRHLGADVLVDVDPHYLTIGLDDAEKKWTPQRKAIAPVHFGGCAKSRRTKSRWSSAKRSGERR